MFGCAQKNADFDDLAALDGEQEPPVESIEELETGEVVKTTVDDAQTKILIGKANLQLEDYDKAIDAFLEAERLNSNLRSDVEPLLAESYMQSARVKLKGFDYEAAVQRYRKMVELDFRRLDDNLDDIVEAYKSYAKSKTSEQDMDEVFDSYEIFIKLSPNNSRLKMGIAEIAYSVGRYSQALEKFYEVKDFDDELKPQAEYYIGQIYLTKAKSFMEKQIYDKAIESFQEAAAADKKLDEQVNTLLVEAYLRYGEELNKSGNFEEAEKQWNKCLDIAPDNMQVFKTLALFYAQRGLDDKALKLYEAISANEPENLEVLEKAADLTVKLKGPKSAQELFVKILGLDSEHIYSRFNKQLADIYFNEEKYHSAVKYYLDYLGFFPGDADAAFQIARAYSFTKEYSLAQEYFSQAVAVDKSWKDKGGFYWGFRVYQARAVIVISLMFLLAGAIALSYYLFHRKKVMHLHKAA